MLFHIKDCGNKNEIVTLHVGSKDIKVLENILHSYNILLDCPAVKFMREDDDKWRS